MRSSPSPTLLMTVFALCVGCDARPNLAQRGASAIPASGSQFDSGPSEFGAGVPNALSVVGEAAVTSTSFGRPFFLSNVSDRLWVADIAGDPFIHVIRIRDGRVEKSGGRRGEGPGEFQSVMDISLRPGDSLGVWAFDPQLGRLTRLSSGAPGRAAGTITAQAGAGRPFTLRWLDRNKLIGINPHDSSASLVLYDTLGTVERSVPFEILGTADIPYRKRRIPSGGFRLCVKPDRSEFAVLFVGGGRIDRYQSSLARLSGFQVPWPSNGDFERDSAGRWQALVPRQYYRDCAATAKHLYALFSGRLTSRFPEGEGGEGVYVQVFNWNGRLERVFRLSRGANALTTLSDSMLFATAVGTDTIYRYRIPTN